jgi:allantoate deiminase
VTTVGRIQAEPNYPAIIPGKVTFTIDARHPEPGPLARLYAHHEALMHAVAGRRGLDISWRTTLDLPPSPSDAATVQLLQTAARDLGIPAMLMHSGAGHDSQVMASRSKIAMIFVQSKDGRSHTPEEFTSIEHAVMGINVLAAGLYRLAYE